VAPANISAALMARVGDPFTLLSALAKRGPVVMMTEFSDTVTPIRAREAGRP
jgi:hypothetical protein